MCGTIYVSKHSCLLSTYLLTFKQFLSFGCVLCCSHYVDYTLPQNVKEWKVIAQIPQCAAYAVVMKLEPRHLLWMQAVPS